MHILLIFYRSFYKKANPFEFTNLNISSIIVNSINESFYNHILDASDNLTTPSYNERQHSTSGNQAKLKYCENGECTKASVAALFIGWPVLIAVSFCLITCLGFSCGGPVGGSAAAACQSACYGAATGGCFSLLQSAGAGGCMGIVFVISIVSIFCSIPTIGTWYSCLAICDNLNECEFFLYC